MINLEATIFYSLLEALAVLFIGMFALLTIQWRRRQTRKQTLMDLVHRLKNSGLQRTTALQALLQLNAKLEDAERDEVAQQILTAETHFYQFLIRALLHRDDRQLLDLDREVELLTDAISKATPHVAAEATSTATPVAVDLAPLKQALDGLQKGQQQLAQEIKAQTESLKLSLSAIPVAALASATTVAVTAGTSVGTAAPAESALESLPDLEDTNALTFPSADADAEADTAAPAIAAAPSAEISNDQIAEMPDDLLASFGETEATTTESIDIAAAAAASNQPTPMDEFEQIADPPSDILDKDANLTEMSASEPVAEPAAPDAEMDIDAILAAATPPERSPAEKTADETTTTESAPAIPNKNNAPSLDELLTAEPLLPEIETNSADTVTKTEVAAGPVKSTANVDDLLAELDELLK